MRTFQISTTRKTMTVARHQKVTDFTVLLVLCAVQLAAANILLAIHHEFRVNNVLTFIEKVKEEKPIETLVVYMDQCFFMDELLAKVELPVVLIDRETSYECREKFNSEILLVRCFSMMMSEENELFEEFKPFPVQTNFRVLYIFENASDVAAVGIFEQYCNSMQEFQIVNMLAITADFDTTRTYLRCRQLDSFEVEIKQYTDSTLLYEDRLHDLGGTEISTLGDLLEPRTMVDEDEHGNRTLSGYVGLLLQAFVRKHNATLKIIHELETNRTIFFEVIQNITRDGLIDIGATLVIPLIAESFNELTYPFELSSYCFMVPLPLDIPLHQIFTRIARPSIYIILLILLLVFGSLFTYILHGGDRLNVRSVLLNDRSIRGLLGQSFPIPQRSTKHFKCVLILICFTSIMVNTMYGAYLQAFLGHPPTEPPLLTFVEIIAAGKKVVAARDEIIIFQTIPGFSMKTHGHLLELFDDFYEFTQHRARLDTNFVYPVSLTRWLVFSEQQELFARKMFFYNTDLCILPFMLLSLPIPKNSRYRNAIERVMLQIHDSGLLKRWMSWNFYEMVRLNRTSLKDLSTANKYGLALGLHDFSWIWCMYIGGITFSLLWFCWELLKWRLLQHQRQKTVTNNSRIELEWLD